MLEDMSARVTLGSERRHVVVVDASESAADHSEQIIDLTYTILDKTKAHLYFLSNCKSYLYDFEQLKYTLPVWYKQNRGKGSFITPIFNEMRGGERVIVIGSGKIYDIPDWENTDILSNTFFFSFSENLAEGSISTQQFTNDASHFMQMISKPPDVKTVEIKGSGFMPYRWDNQLYKIQIIGGQARLSAPRRFGTTCLDISLCYLAERELDIYMRDDHGECNIAPFTVDHDQVNLNDDTIKGTFLPHEESIFRSALKGKNIICTEHGRTYKPTQIWCGSEYTGHCIYKSIENYISSHLIILKDTGNEIVFEAHKGQVVRLGIDRIAIKENGNKYQIYTYDTKLMNWKSEGELKPFSCVSQNGEYVLFR